MAAMDFPFYIPFFKNNATYPLNHLSSRGRKSRSRINFPKLTKRFTLRKQYSKYFLPVPKSHFNRFGTSVFSLFGDSGSLIFNPKGSGLSGQEEEEDDGGFVHIGSDSHLAFDGVEEDGSAADMRPVPFIIAFAIAVWEACASLFS